MPDFFQTQAQRAQNAYNRGWERETASERVDRQLSTVQRIDTFGSSAAQASKNTKCYMEIPDKQKFYQEAL